MGNASCVYPEGVRRLGQFHVLELFINVSSASIESDARKTVRCPVNGIC